jgi:hypothetical protein
MEFSDCPTCGSPAGWVIESLLGNVGVMQLEDGSYEHVGETDINWNTSEPVRNELGFERLLCRDNRHEYFNTLQERN